MLYKLPAGRERRAQLTHCKPSNLRFQPCITVSEVEGARTEDAVTVRRQLVFAALVCYNDWRRLYAHICARWPDGSFSIVGADDEIEALIHLDELISGDRPRRQLHVRRMLRSPGSTETEMLRNAVEAERDRLKSFQRTSATTERGIEVQRELGGSGAYVDAIVE
jgi:hypothetical protein